jgi:hypothetical protein
MLSQRFAFVLVDSSGVCGYTLAALDSQKFYAWVSIGGVWRRVEFCS